VKTFVKNAVSGLFLSVLFLLVMSASARAQVVGGSGEVAGYGGMLHVVGENHAYFGGSGGWNLAPAATVFGEYNYVPWSGEHAQLYGGGVRFNFLPATKIVPYVVGAFGGAEYGGGGGSDHGWYAGFGGGVSCYLTKNVGIRPEYRYVRLDESGEGANSSVFTGGIFYQWGGKGIAKKK
jgi:OmpA-OmpF porin, OOP family